MRPTRRKPRLAPTALLALGAFLAPCLVLGATACDDGPGVPTDQTKAGDAGRAGAGGGGGGSLGGSGTSSGAAGASGASGSSGVVKEPSLTFYRNEGGCPTIAPPPPAEVDTSFVVQWTLVDECTGAGGQHIVAKDVDGSRQFFIGGHACYSLEPKAFPTFPSPPLRYGVLRGRSTAGLHSAGPCVALPSDPPVLSPDPTIVDSIESDTIAERLEVYETLADARAAL